MTMQNKLYTFFSLSDDPLAAKQRSRNLEMADFANFVKLLEKNELLEKFKHLDKRGFKPLEKQKKRKDFCAPANPILNLRVPSMV